MEEKVLSRQKTKLGLSLGILIIVSNLTMSLIYLILQLMKVEKDVLNSYLVTYIANAISIYVVGYLVLKLIVRKTEQIEPKEKKKMKFGELLVLICVTIGGAQFVNIITQMIINIVKILLKIEINNNVQELITNSNPLFTVLFVVIIGPIFEELIFRGTLFKKLRVYGDKTAILYTAIAFGLFHCNIAQIPFAIVVGLFLGYAQTKTNNIIYPIILHMALNSISALTIIAMQFGLEAMQMGIVLVMIALMLFAIIFLPIRLSTKKLNISNESKFEKKKLYKNIGYIFSVISVVLLTIVSAI